MNTRFYIHTVSISRKTYTLDNDRVSREVDSVAYTGSGLLETLRGNDIVRGDKQVILAEYRLFMPSTFAVLSSDKVIVNSKEYTIYSIDNEIFNANHQELLLKTKIN